MKSDPEFSSPMTESPLNLESLYLKSRYGTRVQKISIHLGQSCPNRRPDGSGGCSFCNPESFLPPTARRPADSTARGRVKSEGRDAGGPADPAAQFTAGIAAFERKYPDQKYLPYVQGYTGTLGHPGQLNSWYRSLLEHPRSSGLIIGTRPDCLPPGIMQLLAELRRSYPDKEVRIELGLESFSEAALMAANRGCTAEQGLDAIRKLRAADIEVNGHFILGLPGEDRLQHLADDINSSGLSMVKFHQLQLMRGSSWGDERGISIPLMTVDEYFATLLPILEELSPAVRIGRLCADADEQLLVSHQGWEGMKNYRFTALMVEYMRKEGTWQGRRMKPDAGSCPQTQSTRSS